MACSGRGELVNGTCHCIDGWTSFGDMRAQTGVDCDISKIFVRMVFSFPLLLFPVAFYHSARELYLIKQMKGWKKLVRLNNRVFIIHSSTLLASVVLSAAYIEKLVNPDHAIGIDETVTWLFFIGMTFFFLVVASAFGLMVNVSIKQEKFGGSNSIVNLLRFARYLIPFLSFSMCTAFSLVVAAVYVRQWSLKGAEDLLQAFWIILGITALMLLIGTPLVLHPACRDLDAMVRRHGSDAKADDIRRLSAKLKGIRRQSLFRGLLNTAVFFVMGCWATARHYGPYVIGIQALAFSIIVLALSTLTSTKSNGTSSSQASKATTNRFMSKDGASKEDDSKYQSTKEDVTIVGFMVAGSAHLSAVRSPRSRPNTGEE